MLRVGIAGFGFMGNMHLANFNKAAGADVVAICEANPDVYAKLATRGNIEIPGSDVSLENIELFTDFDEMLDKAGLDAVSITLPSFLHTDFAVKSLNAGLNVLCEKPMALSPADCDKMIAAAQTNSKELMIGHCIRFWPEYAKAKQIVDSGKYGKVKIAAFRRLASAPGWSEDCWFTDENRSGGIIFDLNIHDADFIQYLLGMPDAVTAFGRKDAKGITDHVQVQYHYSDDILVSSEASWAMPQSFGFEMSFNIVTEKASILYDSTRQIPLRVCTADGQSFTPRIAEGDGYSRQIEYFIRKITTQETESILTPGQARDSIRLAAAERKSLQTKQKEMIL